MDHSITGSKPLGDRVTGYRELTQEDIDNINRIKETAIAVNILVEHLSNSVMDIDERWVKLAKDDLQKGFMSLVRSVAKPDSF